jgi:aryl-alcohol dehydrogenase-like predicted oxidoreductase
MPLLRFAHPPETIRLGDNEVRRLGFATSALASDDRASSHAVLRRAVELGVQLINVERAPMQAELIREALSPYPGDLVFATSVGGAHGESGWRPALAPADLRAAVENDLRVLQLEQLQLVQLRWTDQDDVELAEAIDAMLELQRAGKFRQLALGNIAAEQLEQALARTPIAAVVNVLEPALLAACEQRAIAFIPIVTLAPRAATSQSNTLDRVAERLRCTPAQLVIASLLARSPVLLPAPAAAKVVHLEENVGAVKVTLDVQTVSDLAIAA